MCQFKSTIAVKDEREKCGFRLVWSPWTESHEDLVRIFNLRDSRDNLARVEFSPADMSTADKVETYKLKIDEARTPEWLDNAAQSHVIARLSAYIESIVIRGDADLLMGGQFILAKGARVACMSHAAVATVMLGDSQVGEMRETSQVGTMMGTSQVGEMRETSQVGTMWETSQVGTMWETSQVEVDKRPQ